MLRSITALLPCLAVAFALALPANAATVTFDDIPGGSCLGIASGTVSDGFIATFTDSVCINSGSPTTNGLRFAYNGTNAFGAIDVDGPGSVFTFAPVDGLPFDLLSIDFAEFFEAVDFAYPYNAETVTVTGNLTGGGSVSTTFTLDGFNDGPFANDDFETFFLPADFTNLSSIGISSLDPVDPDTGLPTDGYFLIDNIVTSATVVPEPTVVGLVALALLGTGLGRRDTPTS